MEEEEAKEEEKEEKTQKTQGVSGKERRGKEEDKPENKAVVLACRLFC